MFAMSAPSRHGFTLIELSIVLVIIGLLVGGVLVGRDLIKAAEIRAQISQIEEIKTAVNTFQVKYGFLPGDMPPTQASQLGFFTFTGAQAGMGCPSQGYAYGNNDGLVNMNNERYPFWSHLSDAGLVKGNFAGTAGNLLSANAGACVITVGNPLVAPTNYGNFYPQSKIFGGNAELMVYANYWDAPKNSHPIFTSAKKHVISIVDMGETAFTATASELYQMDVKIDDGLPASGNVWDEGSFDAGTGLPSDNQPCTVLASSPLKYDLSPATASTFSCTPAFLF